ncbi:MAG TPA: MBL fold metallo-hydrolase [Flavipsychrobacter sp.]|nr:MBL fold metallo-hydrolase [Flavipsychrobacter sp.]
MKVTFLGSGTSQGVPVISCTCAVCTSSDTRDNRLRSSVFIEVNGTNIVIDTGPDFRYQMLRSKINKLDAVLLTHSHKDHIAGLDDVRAYNYFQQKPMDVYATEETQQALRREYSYIFDNQDYPGIPQIRLHTIQSATPFSVSGIEVTPIRVLHYKMEVIGFRIQDFTYITDANYIAPQEIEKIKGSKVLVLNALRHEQHVSHYTLSQAIEIAKEIGAEETYFTHISHQLGLHKEVDAELPEGMHLAYDCLELEL